MEDFIAEPVDGLDRGALNRRQFCETLALAAAVYAAGAGCANAAPALGASPARGAAPARGAGPAQGFKVIGINHISYACPDYRKARDFYSSVLGMEIAPKTDNGREANLMFGPPPGKGGSFLIPRNARTAGNAKAVVDHICYTIPDWDETKVRTGLTAKGLVPTGREGSLHVYDPFDYDVQIANPAPAPSGAKAASANPALKVALVNHISYTCPDFRRAADWYSKIFNLDQVGASASEVSLPFGKMGEQPYGVAAKDVPLPRLIIGTPDSTQRGAAPGRTSKALVNHIAYTIADFDKERVRAELKRLGYANPLQDGEHSFHIVDPNGFDVQISGIEMTALSG